MARPKDFSRTYRDFTQNDIEELELKYSGDDTVPALLGFVSDNLYSKVQDGKQE
jgi:hypothetical protein